MIDALIKWAIIGLLVASALAAIYKAWDHFVGEPYRESGRVECRLELQPQVDGYKAQVAQAKLDNEQFQKDLDKLRDDVKKFSDQAKAAQDRARIALQAKADLEKAFESERKWLNEIINRKRSDEPCEGICARARNVLGFVFDSVQ